MTPRGIHASGGTEKRDRLAPGDPVGEGADGFRLRNQLHEVALAVLAPGNGCPPLAVAIGVKLAAWSELRKPGIPGFRSLAHAPRSVSADEEATAIVGFGLIVPALGLDAPRHSTTLAPIPAMRWYHYVAYFLGGAFLANAVPHFVAGVSGRAFGKF